MGVIKDNQVLGAKARARTSPTYQGRTFDLTILVTRPMNQWGGVSAAQVIFYRTKNNGDKVVMMSMSLEEYLRLHHEMDKHVMEITGDALANVG